MEVNVSKVVGVYDNSRGTKVDITAIFYPKKNEQFLKNLNSINSTINKVICEKNKSINEYNIFYYLSKGLYFNQIETKSTTKKYLRVEYTTGATLKTLIHPIFI